MSAALRQLLEFGLFHGDPHPGNIFAMRDGRIAYVDFGNVAVLSQVILHMLSMEEKKIVLVLLWLPAIVSPCCKYHVMKCLVVCGVKFDRNK